MGRPAKQKPAEVFETEFEPTPEEQELDDFLEEVGPSTAVIHILRMKPDGSRPQVGKTTMDQIREDPWQYLRENFNSGKFMLLFRGSDRRIHGARMLEIEAGSTNGTTTTAKPAEMHDRLMDTLLLALVQNMRPPQPLDMGSMMAGLAAVMTAMKPAPVEGASKPVDPLAMFQSIVTMYQTLKPKEEKSELEKIRDVAGIIREFSEKGGSEADSPWAALADVGKEVVNRVGPMLSGVIPGVKPAAVMGAVSGTPAGGPSVVGVDGARPMNPPAIAAGQTVSAEENLQRWLLSQIAFLKHKALSGKDPEFWVDYIFDNAEEPGCQAIMYAIRRGAAFEHLLSLDPEIRDNPQLTLWFKHVYDNVKAELLSTDVDSGGSSRNESNVVPNGGTSAEGQSAPGGPVASPHVPVANPN